MEQEVGIAFLARLAQEARRHDLVGVDVAPGRAGSPATRGGELVHRGLRQAGQVAWRDRRGGRGARSRPPSPGSPGGCGARALAAVEVAVRGRGAALPRRDEVAVHGDAHRAARLAPLEARRRGRCGRGLRPRPRASPASSRATTIAGTDAAAGRAITAAASRRSSMRAVGARADEHAVDRHVASAACPARGPCSAALRPCARARSASRSAPGSGTRRRPAPRPRGSLPQVTIGASASHRATTSRSKTASASRRQRLPVRERRVPAPRPAARSGRPAR